MVRDVRRWDLPFIRANLILLLVVAFLPFPTAVLGNHLDAPLAAVLYASAVTFVGVVSRCLWWYIAYRAHLTEPAPDLSPGGPAGPTGGQAGNVAWPPGRVNSWGLSPAPPGNPRRRPVD